MQKQNQNRSKNHFSFSRRVERYFWLSLLVLSLIVPLQFYQQQREVSAVELGDSDYLSRLYRLIEDIKIQYYSSEKIETKQLIHYAIDGIDQGLKNEGRHNRVYHLDAYGLSFLASLHPSDPSQSLSILEQHAGIQGLESGQFVSLQGNLIPESFEELTDLKKPLWLSKINGDGKEERLQVNYQKNHLPANIVNLDKDSLYFRPFNYNLRSAKHLEKSMLAHAPKNVILDLRFQQYKGDTQAVSDFLSVFGERFSHISIKSKTELKEYRAKGDIQAIDENTALAILINKHSRYNSERIALALKARSGTVILGQKSAGDYSEETQLLPLEDHRITIPSGLFCINTDQCFTAPIVPDIQTRPQASFSSTDFEVLQALDFLRAL